ncbi:uncharacterized protein N7473_008125 [Penicillium subrubescens]|uniref:Coiled-coil domain-containing protein 174 n=1 Tax=Penicillium subrubescens TaxID=1316194 RepID=A0A1Q5TF76_9EURO|nr:uncharacterized protein N7473_008125 [Penicillium subrubescens]KAJ5891897.1 hypothetical protein N7473_008125 [Penicillium subrubescens]OKO98880.1 hypothetical protein PENSUB_8797 [Penicillium subrubescens]
MAPEQSSLYGKPRAKASKTQEITSSSNLAFNSQLSSLIAQSSSTTSHGRPRPSKTSKSDIFGKQNKGATKRAAADLEEDDHHVSNQVHKKSKDIGAIDDATLNRSKQRMAKKVRMYEDMKKGLHLIGEDSDDDLKDDYVSRLRRKEKVGLVDFDTKWADEERKKKAGSGEEYEEDEDDENASIVSYEDEFGRTRHGTRFEAARAAVIKEEEENRGRATEERWRPSRPKNLIYGEAIQSEAFNPEATIAAQMARLAAQRDLSPEPEYLHYDADGEVRNRGTGFYAFSRDEEERKKQMEALKKIREDTQQQREKLAARAAQRQAALEDRRRQIQELRKIRLAEKSTETLATPPPISDH